jgi:N6-adenosine-specific RNA methylase IME4
VTRAATIVADPPWAYRQRPATGKRDRLAAAADFYPVMSIDEIAALPVSDLAATDAHLYLWITNPLLFDGIDRVITAWGFTYRTLVTWNKTGPTGLGRWFRGRTEHVAFCVRGNLPIPPERREQNILSAVNGRHSEKPDAFYDMVERVSPGPYLELFARRRRLGWEAWGNEVDSTVEVA